MFKNQITLLAIAFSLMLSTTLFGQASEIYDLLILQNGESVKGTILELKENDYLKFKEADSGLVKRYEMEEISKIQQIEEDALFLEEEEVYVPQKRIKPAYAFKEEGRFVALNFGFTFGKRTPYFTQINPIFGQPEFRTEETAIGFNVQLAIGQQYNRRIGAGLGFSYDAYNLEDGESVITPLLHFRGYLNAKNVAPFWALTTGYGFALNNESQGIRDARGGIMAHPEMGLRIGASEKTNFTLSVGYRLQKARYTQEYPFNGDIQYRNITYRRFLLSIGLLF